MAGAYAKEANISSFLRLLQRYYHNNHLNYILNCIYERGTQAHIYIHLLTNFVNSSQRNENNRVSETIILVSITFMNA